MKGNPSQIAAQMQLSDLEKESLDFGDKHVKNKFATFMVIYLAFTVILLVCCVSILKRLFGRERPTRVASKYRLCNMRKLEHHKSFPSGDATAASFFLAIYVYVWGLNAWCMIFFTIFVSLGRVYVFCHWIGDTIAGSFLGTALAYFLYSKAHFG